MPAIATAGAAVRADAPEFERVVWHKLPNMRKLFFHCSVLCIASATTGFDGYGKLGRVQDIFNRPY
jgi:hypothetical protein